MTVTVDFCGEVVKVPTDTGLTIGRDADFVVDENRFLHRHFLRIHKDREMWWLANVGSHISANIADTQTRVHSWLPPGATIPIVFSEMLVIFTAGPTTYELTVRSSEPSFSSAMPYSQSAGITTVGVPTLTPAQHILIVALAEPALMRQGDVVIKVPTSAAAAERLGWPLTKFNRKLDNVCERLTKHGVRGLHGNSRTLATDRRVRLVEYALSVGLVGAEHLSLLEDVRA